MNFIITHFSTEQFKHCYFSSDFFCIICPKTESEHWPIYQLWCLCFDAEVISDNKTITGYKLFFLVSRQWLDGGFKVTRVVISEVQCCTVMSWDVFIHRVKVQLRRQDSYSNFTLNCFKPLADSSTDHQSALKNYSPPCWFFYILHLKCSDHQIHFIVRQR